LNADANEQKRRKPQNDLHPAFTDDRGETIGKAIAKIDAQCYESGTDYRRENRRRLGPR